MRTPLLVTLAALTASAALAQNPIPKPTFQGDFFGEMGRIFSIVEKVDPKAKTLTVRRERDGQRLTVPIREDTELHFRDSWGELSDYFPGERVMLFTYVDEERNLTYPRAVQDEIHVSARHGWFATVTRIDTAARKYFTHREEKNGEGKVTKVEDKEYFYTPDVKVWKGETPTGIGGLKPGDEVIQQQVEQGGKLAAVEIIDRKGDDAIRAAQDARHKQDQDRLGLPAYVNDLEPISGSVTISVAWSGSDRAKALKPGDVLALVPEQGKPFGAAVASVQGVDTRQRIQLVTNARVVSRLWYGHSLRLFMPGTGPQVPTGRSGVPDAAFKP